MKSTKISKNTASEGEICNERKGSLLHLLRRKGLFCIKYIKYVVISPFGDAIIVCQGWLGNYCINYNIAFHCNRRHVCFLAKVATLFKFCFPFLLVVTYLSIFLFCRETEGNLKKKKLSKDSLPKKAKTPENIVDSNGTPQENDSGTKTKNIPSKTINGGERGNKNSQVSQEQNRPIKQGQKILKDKEESRKGKQKQENPKRRRLTFKEMKELAVKKRLQRQFRGAQKERLSNLSTARLASYGLTKKKKKKS